MVYKLITNKGVALIRAENLKQAFKELCNKGFVVDIRVKEKGVNKDLMGFIQDNKTIVLLNYTTVKGI